MNSPNEVKEIEVINLKSISAIKGEILLPADREQFLSALIMASYSEETQKLNTSSDALEKDMIEWAHRAGIGVALQADGIEITGGGWGFTPHTSEIQSLGSIYVDLLQISWLRFHRKQIELIDFGEHYLDLITPFIKTLGCTLEKTESQVFLNSISQPKIPSEFPGLAPWLRNDRLLQYWPSLKETEFKELYSGREFLINLAQLWGNTVEKQVPNTQELSELERRLLKMRGGLQDRRSTFKITPALTHRKRFYPLWGNATIASTLTTLGICTPGSDFILKDVLISSSRSHFFQLARKLGADVEIMQKKESLGDTVANVRVRYTRELVGRKISGESLFQSLEEFGLLAVLASRAEGETVIRGFAKLPGHFKLPLNELIENLKKTTVDIGEFEDGLVVRGKPELDSGDFDAHGLPNLSLALWVLGCIAKGKSTLNNSHRQSLEFLNNWLEAHYV